MMIDSVKEIANTYKQILEEAYSAYAPLVDELCRNEEATENDVGWMLDWLL